MKLAISHAEARKQWYKHENVPYHQPWLVLMTDGQPDRDDDYRGASQRVLQLEADKKLTIFPIGIGVKADMNVLAMFSQKRKPLKLQGLKFQAFFEWLSASMERRSASAVGAKTTLPPIDAWSEVD